MIRTRGGGVKGRLNNVKKKLHYWCRMASLMMHSICSNSSHSDLYVHLVISGFVVVADFAPLI